MSEYDQARQSAQLMTDQELARVIALMRHAGIVSEREMQKRIIAGIKEPDLAESARELRDLKVLKSAIAYQEQAFLRGGLQDLIEQETAKARSTQTSPDEQASQLVVDFGSPEAAKGVLIWGTLFVLSPFLWDHFVTWIAALAGVVMIVTPLIYLFGLVRKGTKKEG